MQCKEQAEEGKCLTGQHVYIYLFNSFSRVCEYNERVGSSALQIGFVRRAFSVFVVSCEAGCWIWDLDCF